MRDGSAIIAVEGVSKTFRTNASQIQALSDTSLTIGKGQFICLIGAWDVASPPCCG